MKQITILLTLFVITISGCRYMIPYFAKRKEVSESQTSLSVQSNKFFWNQLHQGNYDSIPQVIDYLNRAIKENPNDLKSITHLGFSHIWLSSERQRLYQAQPSITEHIFLAKKYFEESNIMNPHDARIVGFLADMNLGEGSLLKNRKEVLKGYFMGLDAIKKWPQFNKFTIGYFFSGLNKDDENFQKGLNWQYETMDDCSCSKNPKDTDYKEAIKRIKESKNPRIYRACLNSWIAPHNWEGFFLNWGDMLTKKGNIDEAKKIYQLAKESETYNEWPYKDILEKRVIECTQNSIDFNKPLDELNLKNQNVIMFNSKFACSGCHQMSKKEFNDMGYKELEKTYYSCPK